MSKEPLKTRFCPSPTGLVHIGNVRTALFNALLARHANGIFLVRIEDTDKLRSDERYTQALLEDLTWLGLSWQEGPNHDGKNGPYWQSQRQAIYDKYYEILEQKGLAYPCFCTEQQLAISRKVQQAAGKPPRYIGTCRSLTKEQVQEKLAQGLKPALRFAVPHNEEVIFTDLVRGEQKFNSNDLGDFIIRRTDGTPPFIYCNAIDDALMGVTHALRGEDHLTNAPRQLLILEALNLLAPQYGHINLIVGSDGSPLSKRHGSRSVQELRQEGYLPEAINNYLARLGHHYADESFMTLEKLAQLFSITSLGHAPTKYDPNQLLYWQKQAIIHANSEELWQWMGGIVHQLVPKNLHDSFLETVGANITFPQDAAHWAKIFFTDELPLDIEKKQILQTAGKEFFNIALTALEKSNTNINAINDALKNQLGLKGKALFQPLRVALTGELHGPEMVKIFELLGKEKIRKRLEKNL